MVASYRLPRRQTLSIQERLRQLGLIAYWELDGAANANEPSDVARNGPLDLTRVGTVGSVAGPSNNLPLGRTMLTGADNYLGVASTPLLSPGRVGLTVVCWLKVTTYANATFPSIVSKWNTTGNLREWNLFGVQGSSSLSFQLSPDGTGTANPGVTVAFATGTYRLVVATWGPWTAGRAALQFNRGATNFSATNPITSTFAGSAAFRIGVNDGGTANNRPDIQIATLGIWNRQLLDAELDWLYNAGQGRSLVRGV